MAHVRGFAGLLLGLWVAGCAGKTANVIEGDDGTGAGGKGSTIGDDDGKTVPADPKWSCAGDTTADPTPVDVTFKLRNLIGTAPIIGATARLCTRIDVSCDNPLAEGESDGEGHVTFSVSGSGYVWIGAAGDGADQTSPTLHFFESGDFATVREVQVQVVTPSVLGSLSQVLGAPQKDGNGIVIASVFDCKGAPAEGLRLRSSFVKDESEALLFYAQNSIPTRHAELTDKSGFGGLVNVPAGSGDLEAILPAPSTDGRVVSTFRFFTRPNTLSSFRMRPRL